MHTVLLTTVVHVYYVSPPLASAQSTPPWKQQQQPLQLAQNQTQTALTADQSLVQTLNNNKLQEQAILQSSGITDPLEKEFGFVVKSVMDTCSKESIAVSFLLLSSVMQRVC